MGHYGETALWTARPEGEKEREEDRKGRGGGQRESEIPEKCERMDGRQTAGGNG